MMKNNVFHCWKMKKAKYLFPVILKILFENTIDSPNQVELGGKFDFDKRFY
jgi:hypothetical protein